MPIKQESLQTELRNLLKSKGYSVTNLNSDGKTVPVPEDADVFQFNFVKDNVNYGTVSTAIDGLRQLVVYFNDKIANSPKTNKDNSESWEKLLRDLKNFSRQRQLSFELSDQDNLASDMAKRTHMKKLDEGYYAMGKKSSYNDGTPNVKMIIQHTRPIEEGEQRYRNIAKIFVENINGERFLLPTNKPGLARVYARHVAEGGTPYDERGVHITSLCEEYSKMAGFVRATRNGQFNESAQKLVTEGINHYEKLRESLRKMASGRGYNSYFESYTPALMEDEGSIDLSNMFMSSSLDPRIESVMPILSKLSKNISETSEMKQVTELSEWADKLTEFANNDGGNGGDDYLRTLASAWYNQDLSAIAHEVKKDKNPKKKNMMDRVIDAQVAVEKMLARGVVCGDGKVRKFSIDYNSDFDGVVMTYEDYAEYSDYGDDAEDIDSRTGKPWQHSKYDQIEFTDDQLDEGAQQQGVAEGSHDDEDDGLIAGRYTPQQWAKMVAIVRKKAQEQDAKKKIAVVKTDKPIGTRVSDIGPGGKEYNVKTDSEWDKQKGVAEGSGGNWYIRVNGKILNDTKFKPVIFSSEDEARSHAMKLADKKRIPLSQIKLTKSWMDAPEQGVAEEVDTGQYDAIKSTHKGQSTDDWDKNYREKIKQYAKELDQRQKEKEQTVKEGQEDLNEGIMDSLNGIINKIKMTPGIQKFIGAAKAKQDQLIQALQHSANGKDLVANIQQAVGGQQAVAEGWGQKIGGAVAASAGGGLLAGAADIMMRAYIAMGKPDLTQMMNDPNGRNAVLLVGWLVVLGALAMLAGGSIVKKGMDKDAEQPMREGQEDLDAILRIIRK